jgi:reductive dehalogenase
VMVLEWAMYLLYEKGVFGSGGGTLVLWFLLGVPAALTIFLVQRTASNPRALAGSQGYVIGATRRFDEREQVFARNRSLPPGSGQYHEFYAYHRDWEQPDVERRAKGSVLGIPGAIDRPFEGPNMAAMNAAFAVPPYFGREESTHPKAAPGMRRITLSPDEATLRVKGWTRHLGADLVGVAPLNPLWVYSHRGEIFYDNWRQWGESIVVEHPYAVVFATEMDWRMVTAAPHSPSVVESAVNYAKGAMIATQLAAYIVNLGYSATANHSRHYDLLMVPLAVDAGLGELGRFGYLITREFGPRVRLFAVSTDLPLVADKPVDIGVADFCRRCKKCASCCPSQSIPDGEPRADDGILRWKLNAETCFAYWAKTGTDCNVCMRVCPWSHPRTLAHRVIVSLVVRNRFSRRLFRMMDDLFYGPKPKPLPPPAWAGCRGMTSDE